MEKLIIYLLKVSVALMLFYPFYLIVLRRSTFYWLNRFTLLGSLVLSLGFPLIPSISQSLPSSPGIVYNLQEVSVFAVKSMNHATSLQPGLWLILSSVYITGFLLLLLLFIRNLTRIFRLKGKANRLIINGIKVFVLKEPISSFSFGPWIFMDEGSFETDKDRIVLQHELAHVRQYHTLDLVLAEMLKVIFWFHPLVWLYKRLLQEIHEYLADEAVISDGTEPARYMQLLFAQNADIQMITISNHFNHSLIKRRFTMITKIKSGKRTAIVIGILLPIFTAIFFAVVNMISSPVFSQKQELNFVPVKLKGQAVDPQKEKEDKKVYQSVKKMPEYQGGFEVLQQYIMKEIKYPEFAKKLGLQATFYFGFIINAEGKMTNIKIRRISTSFADEKAQKPSKEDLAKATKELETEALRVMNSIPPQWIPGEEKGKKVDVELTLPIKFKLN